MSQPSAQSIYTSPEVQAAVNRRLRPVESRRLASMLPGAWATHGVTLTLSLDKHWSLNPEAKATLPGFNALKTCDGEWSYGGGYICFLQADRMLGFQGVILAATVELLRFVAIDRILELQRQPAGS